MVNCFLIHYILDQNKLVHWISFLSKLWLTVCWVLSIKLGNLKHRQMKLKYILNKSLWHLTSFRSQKKSTKDKSSTKVVVIVAVVFIPIENVLWIITLKKSVLLDKLSKTLTSYLFCVHLPAKILGLKTCGHFRSRTWVMIQKCRIPIILKFEGLEM